MKKLPPAPLPKHELLTPREVAAFLRVSVQVVYQLLNDEDLPSLKVGLQYRIPRSKFLRWFEAAQQRGRGSMR